MALCRGPRLLLFSGWPIIDKPAELGRIGELLPGIPTIPGYMPAALCCANPIRILAKVAGFIPGRSPARLDVIPMFIGFELLPKPDIVPMGEDMGRTLPIPITLPRPPRPTLLTILPMFMAEPSPIITFLDIGCCCCACSI